MKISRLALVALLLAPSATVHADAPAPATRAATRTARRGRAVRLAQNAPRPQPQRPAGGNTAQTTPPANTTAPRPANPTPNPAPPVNPAPPPGSPLTANQIVERLQNFYDRTTDFEADFQQVSRNQLAGRDQRRNGHVRFLRPGRMRWDYQNPAGDVIVSDGTTLWAYEAAARQAIQSNLAQSQLPSALSFLTGQGRLSNDFTFRLLPAARYQYPGGYVLEARPNTPNPSFDRIVFYVEGANFQVTRTVVIDAQGNTNRFDFTNPRVNMRPAQTVFQWTPPAGTQVVRP